MKEKICRRCNESWPNDEEFYRRATVGLSKICRACQFEQRKTQKQRAQERLARMSEAEQERRRLAENERVRIKVQKRRLLEKNKPV